MFKSLVRIITFPVRLMFSAGKTKPSQQTLYYSIESAKIDIQDAEKQLKEKRYPPIGIFHGGGGGYMVKEGNLIIDGNGYGEGSRTQAQGSITDAGHGHGGASLGYVLKETHLFRIYPLIGMGGGGGNIVSHSENEPQKPRFYTGGGSMLVWFGLGVDMRLPIWKLRLVLGFRTGVNIPLLGDKSHVYKGAFTRWNLGVEWESTDERFSQK